MLDGKDYIKEITIFDTNNPQQLSTLNERQIMRDKFDVDGYHE